MSVDVLPEELEQEETPWPAFVDLLTATTLLFTTLVVVFVFLANRTIDAERTQRVELRRALERAKVGADGTKLYDVADDGQFIRITLQAEATFPSKAWRWSDLKPQGKTALLEIAGILNRDSVRTLYRQVRILGHTDQVPYGSTTDFTNWELSAARAAVVARYLVNEGGIDPCFISASGLGSYYPASIRTPEGLRKAWEDRMTMNRRIEIEIVPVKWRNAEEGPPCFRQGDGTSPGLGAAVAGTRPASAEIAEPAPDTAEAMEPDTLVQ